MVLAAHVGGLWWAVLHEGGDVSASGGHQRPAELSYDDKIPCKPKGLVLDRDVKGGLSAQIRMSFSSGAAQTKGGGSFCMATYSFESWVK
jgi:hypothetical protein